MVIRRAAPNHHRRRAAATAAIVLGALAVPASADADSVEQLHPGQSVQHALDRAHAGDTVRMGPGVYRENLHITTDRVSLVGSGPGRTTLVPPSTPGTACAPADQAVGICVGDPTAQAGTGPRGVRVAGLTVRGFPGAAILMFGTTGGSIERTVLAHNGNGALLVLDRSSTVRHNAAVDNANFGVAAVLSSRTRILYNKTRGNFGGVEIASSGPADATVLGNDAMGNEFGVLISDAVGGRIEGNVLTGNCAGLVMASEGSQPAGETWYVRRNRIVGNSRVCPVSSEDPLVSGGGLLVIGARDISITDNTILRNRPGAGGASSIFAGGIVVSSARAFGGHSDPADVTVAHNRVRRNAPFDLRYDGSGHHVVFRKNTCSTSLPASLCRRR